MAAVPGQRAAQVTSSQGRTYRAADRQIFGGPFLVIGLAFVIAFTFFSDKLG